MNSHKWVFPTLKGPGTEMRFLTLCAWLESTGFILNRACHNEVELQSEIMLGKTKVGMLSLLRNREIILHLCGYGGLTVLNCLLVQTNYLPWTINSELSDVDIPFVFGGNQRLYRSSLDASTKVDDLVGFCNGPIPQVLNPIRLIGDAVMSLSGTAIIWVRANANRLGVDGCLFVHSVRFQEERELRQISEFLSNDQGLTLIEPEIESGKLVIPV